MIFIPWETLGIKVMLIKEMVTRVLRFNNMLKKDTNKINMTKTGTKWPMDKTKWKQKNEERVCNPRRG